MNLYEALGVPTHATLEEIMAAYRRLAQKHHPDKGGDNDLFVTIKKAYETLSDPDTRAHYDRYGMERPIDGVLEKAKQMVAALFSQVMNGNLTEHMNVLDQMTKAIDVEERKAKGHLKSMNAEREKNLIVLHRLTKKGDEHLLLDLLMGRRKEVWQAYRTTQANLRAMAIAKGLLAGYEYTPDAFEVYQPYAPRSAFWVPNV